MSDLPEQDVLIVEDEPGVRSVMSHVLTGAGYSVTCAENGQEALSAVERSGFRAVVCDVHMPVLDGMSFYQALEEKDASLAGRVLFVTAVADIPSVAEFFVRKKCRVLEKPYELKELLDIVSGLVGRPPAREMLF
jgi:CheY-like chemotaxis protein